MGIVLPQIAAGKLKPLAVTSPQRSAALPDTSTLAEQGLDPHLQNWFGVFAPGRTPAPIVEKLNAAFVKGLRDPSFEAQFLKPQAYDAVGNTPAEFAAFLKSDRANAKDVVATTGIRLDDAAPAR
jgi:tripartite-type tricarboxylate transporter receptor subunit TctC